MNDFENLSSRLANIGFWPTLRKTPEGWHCDLHNGVIQPHRLPCGNGRTAFEALREADAQRMAMTETTGSRCIRLPGQVRGQGTARRLLRPAIPWPW
jgi:hypothetical protein